MLLRELRNRGCGGGYTILTDWLRPQRQSARTVAVRRFETPIGHQAQVDWGHLGTIEVDGKPRPMWGFTFTLGYSRAMMAEAALDQSIGKFHGPDGPPPRMKASGRSGFDRNVGAQ